MTSFVLFAVVVILAVLAVRIGALAMELTGMPKEQGFFQSLSCFTGTGFTTREAEAVTRNRERRKIAMVIMILGNLGSITLIATLATHIQNMLAGEGRIFLPFSNIVLIHSTPGLAALIKLAAITLAMFIIYKVLARSRLSEKIFETIRERMKKMNIIHPSISEELVSGISGYDVVRLRIPATALVCGKSIAENQLRSEYDIQVLALEKEAGMVPSPPPESIINAGDIMICFGPRESVYKLIESPDKNSSK